MRPERGGADVVLIVDDQPDNLALLHDALDDAGYTVLVATDGASALQRARQAQPDIVLLDAVMPGLDGFEVARRLKADEATGDDDGWLVVLRESSDASMIEAMTLAFPLTAREAEVLYWVAKGKTNKDIADILSLSPRTVTKHLEHVFEKLGVETRTAAAGMAMNKVPQLGRAG